ncbi:glycoside hydrolase domain-containing protein [Bifidobacterium castoris]|uniref:Rv2525c-like glycoside hydrolase-like domain-containing protein n=1 Tax=Bifidobacterium castoris TaxID=2306972 RepID=A0A430F867_9BIFI|nr:glycoside hydrolase domain-containing protein [Bifidobacterium castoris]RSX49046.1 hypothetical protein D2E22_0466 [Bifidobacterium castoris]
MTDEMVLATQKWLNETYGADARFDKVPENGATGWVTVYGLLHALQIELGIEQTADAFGPGTQSRFQARWPQGIAQQPDGAEAESNVYAIIQGALWCKGYGTGAVSITRHFYGGTGAAIRELKTDMGIGGDSTVTMDIMMALLSMQQFKLIASSGGRQVIREVQQQINEQYRSYTGIIPTDGLYGREMNMALIQVLQALEGFTPDEATGNFGNGTRSRLKTIDASTAGANPKWVWLASAALVCNGYGSSVYSVWNTAISGAVEEFQHAYALPASGGVDAYTWMSLLTSCGNPNRPAVACDTRFEITDEFAEQLKADGYEIVGRYLSEPNQDKLQPKDYWKAIRPGELERIVEHGLKYFPIFQEDSTSLDTFTSQTGARHAQEAAAAAQRLGVPQTVIYFAVDYDATDPEVTAAIIPYFKAIHDTITGGYKVGIYASRNICTRVCDAGYAVSSFVSDMSTGFSGNLGFPIPSNWNYDQFTEISYHDWDLDRVAYSGQVMPCDTVLPESVNDPLYKWVRRTEEECMSGMSGLSNPLSAFQDGIGEFILDWLRKPEYWSSGSSDSQAMWQAYTPEVSSPEQLVQARVLCATVCSQQPAIKNSDFYPDLAHMAATALGYLTWGVETQQNHYGFGDLGGWPLDLLQIWGKYVSEGHDADLATWLKAHLGSVSDGMGFGYADVLADADAWIIAKYMKEQPSGHSLSEAVKELFQQNQQQRIVQFYNERFGGKASNVSEAFLALGDGIDIGNTNFPITTWLLCHAAHADRMPVEDEARSLAQAYAAFISNPSR